jgi:uncharacterized protein YjbI with pentapeptide repeats
MDLVDTGNCSATKTSELEKAAYEAEKFELAVTFELKSGDLSTYKITGRGAESNFTSERVGYKGQFVHGDLIRAMENLIADNEVKRLHAIVVKTTKGSLSTKQLRPLAIAAWAEAAQIDCPPENEVGKEVQSAKDVEQSTRDSLVADLRGGQEGLKRWSSRKGSENVAAKHLRDSELSGLNLSGVSFAKSGITDLQNSSFKGAQLSNAKFDHCDLSDCNFRSAIIDGANCQHIRAECADFSESSLVEAFFTGSSLANADFTNANLTGANFTYADLRGANLATANLTDVCYNNTRYDENTRWPVDYVPPPDLYAANPRAPRGLVFAGKGRDPFLIQQVKAMAPPGGELDFETFVSRLEKEFDQERLKKSLKMLKAESFQLFAEVAPDSLVGVVKSQTDANLVYSCRLSENGNYSCCTQNLNPCGGLRGALCKHLLVLLIGITKAGELSPALACEWVLSSRRFKNANLDKDIMSATFLRYKGAEAGELDWRPTETMPEDYYAF